MPFLKLASLPQIEPVPGCRARFVHSDNMTLAHWEFDSGASIPEHAHPHEQVVNIVEGEFELTVAGETKIIRPGDVVTIPPNAPHSGRSISRCRIIDAFYPTREDYR
jgi:quercetin dioxygenase-like cupin family protein